MYLLTKNPKNVQSAGAICLAKVIQNSSEELVSELLEEITERIIGIFRSN